LVRFFIQNIFMGEFSPDSDAAHYVIIRKLIAPPSIHDGHQNQHGRYPVQTTELFFRKAVLGTQYLWIDDPGPSGATNQCWEFSRFR
jgi:hypothetical protein